MNEKNHPTNSKMLIRLQIRTIAYWGFFTMVIALSQGFKERESMKTKLILIAGLFFGLNLNAQKTHQFKILKDDPNAVSENMVSLNLCHAHFSKRELLKAGMGAEVLWGIGNKIQAQAHFMYYYLSINSAGGPNIDFEPGGAYTLGQKNRTKDVKVILNYKESSSTVGNVTTTTKEVNYIPTTGNVLSKTKVRGGIYIKRSGVDISTTPTRSLSVNSAMGVYGGMEFTKQACLISEVDGVKGITSGYTRIYLDGMILPVSKYQTAPITMKPGIFGARFGFATYFNPNKKKSTEYGKLVHYQVYPTIFFKSEVGFRGGEGWFFNLGAGLTVFKNR